MSTQQALFLTVANPDEHDTVLGHPTTDAPLTFHPTDNARTTFCTDLPPHDVVGLFTISYVLGRTADSDTPILGAGAFRFKWNVSMNRKAGLELATCASTDLGAPCKITPEGADTWCIDTTASADRTIGIRAWLAAGAVAPIGPNVTVR
jgi:hypothetical protein